MKRRMKMGEIEARLAALDTAAAAGPLASEEIAERETLSNRLYYHVWRKSPPKAPGQRRHAA